MTRKRMYVYFFLLLVLASVIGCSGDGEKEERAANANSSVSMFSWHYEMTKPDMSNTYTKMLEQLSVTRVYQNVSVRVMQNDMIRQQVKNLTARGIETVGLMGDKSWVEDGLAEYQEVVDSIDAYNQSVDKPFRIQRIAVDVEVHLLPEWDRHRKRVFRKYISRMAQAKIYANARNLQVIQVIPAYYDDVSTALFDRFLEDCCDEVSIMNYDRKHADTAIRYEVESCEKREIPVETIFETMPVSRKHGVDENTTYYYEGMNRLKEDADSLREVYGPQLGIAYHHFTTIYELAWGE